MLAVAVEGILRVNGCCRGKNLVFYQVIMREQWGVSVPLCCVCLVIAEVMWCWNLGAHSHKSELRLLPFVCVCVCVCVIKRDLKFIDMLYGFWFVCILGVWSVQENMCTCVRERKRERERDFAALRSPGMSEWINMVLLFKQNWEADLSRRWGKSRGLG